MRVTEVFDILEEVRKEKMRKKDIRARRTGLINRNKFP
jgi:hypothetical protein